jgi:transposase
MTQQPAEIQVKDIDHLGIVAGIIDQMGWVDAVNELVGVHSLEQVSTGQVLKAMILNGLGFVAAPLYLFSEFFEGKATEHLIGEGVKPEHLNDDRLGRALDKFYALGVTQVFTKLALKGVEQFEVLIKSIHLDSSSFHVDGEYRCESTEDAAKSDAETSSSSDNLKAMKQLKWLTRVPLTLAQAKEVLLELQPSEWMTSRLKGYRIAERHSRYGGIQQRWLIIESEQRQQADIQQLHKRIGKEHQQQSGKLRQLSTQVFACQPDAQQAALKFEQSLKYHRLCDLKFTPQAHYTKAGRPRLAQAPSRITYCVQATLVPNPEVIEVEMTRAGRFILATNVLDANQLSADDALAEYKDQQSNERGFRFLKDPLFFTSSVFVKSPKRVEALVMVMGLCLLVYSLAQRQLRQALAQAGEGIKNQVGKLTERPTLRWVFQSFQSVHLVMIDGTKQIINLTPQRQKVLRFLGTEAMRYYQLC